MTDSRDGQDILAGAAVSDSGSLTEGTVAETPVPGKGAQDGSQEPSDGYLEDDEAFLPGDDIMLASGGDFAMAKQLDGVVSWEVTGLLDEEGKPLGKRALRTVPPVLRISGSDESYAEFMLTRELAKTMEGIFADVSRAYYGIPPKKADRPALFSKEGLEDRAGQVSSFARQHPFLLVLAVVVMMMVVAGAFL